MFTARHSKLGIALVAGIGAAASAAALAVPGAAQTSGTELHFSATSQKGAGFAPKHRIPVPGDRLGFGDKVTGDDTGVARAACTIVGGNSSGLPCTIWLKLSKGTLALQGMLPQTSHNAPIAITGGTGAYNGARGTAFATDVSSSKTSIVLDLLP
jgi:hypothetical protein